MFKTPEIPLNPPLTKETSGTSGKERAKLIGLVKAMDQSKALPRSFSRGLESLKSGRRPQTREKQERENSGVDKAEGLDKLGIRENQMQELMACLPGRSLSKVRFEEKVDLSPDPTREGRKVFSAVRLDRDGKVELSIFSSDNYGGHERARGLMIDEFSTELLRAYAKANDYSGDLDVARAVEEFLKDKVSNELVSGQIEKKMNQAWETLICLAMHVPVSKDLDWAESFKLSLMATHGLPRQDAERVIDAMAKFFNADPNEFVPAFQDKEKDLKRTMRLHELSQTVLGAIAETSAVSIFTHGLQDPEALIRFAAAVRERANDFHIENERFVLVSCAELALGAAFACKEAELDGDNFSEAVSRAGTHARALGGKWGKLLSKRKEISDALAEAWHQAMSTNKA